MHKCYISDIELDDTNISEEHIIPNALGGHLKSKYLISEKINNDLFAKLDAILIERIELAQLIQFKRDRGVQPDITGKNEMGIEFKVNAIKKSATMKAFKPIIKKDKDGSVNTTINASFKKEYFAALRRKNPNLTDSEFEKKFRYSEETKSQNQFLFYKYGGCFIDEIEPFKSVSKIATNYAVYNNVNKVYLKTYIDYIKGNLEFNNLQLGYFYPKNRLIYNFEKNEISNILILKGCSKEQLLYCYIELFNVHCFIVNLSNTYQGPNFETSHIWDLKNCKKLHKTIKLEIDKKYLSNRDYPHDGIEIYNDYKERLERLCEIEKIRLQIKF